MARTSHRSTGSFGSGGSSYRHKFNHVRLCLCPGIAPLQVGIVPDIVRQVYGCHHAVLGGNTHCSRDMLQCS